MIAKDLMTQDYISIDGNETLSKLLGRFITKKQKEAVVMDGNKYMGVVSKKNILDSRIDASKVKVHKYARDVHMLEENASIKRTCEYMVMSDSHLLPITYNDRRMKGVVFAKDVIRELKIHAKGYKARDIERTALVTLKDDDDIGKAISTLKHSRISHIPIIDSSGNLAGVISTIDILEKFTLFAPMRQGSGSAKLRMGATKKQRNLMEMPLESFMSKDVWQAEENDDLTKVIDEMLDKEISDVVITKNKKPVGIITIKDVLRLFSIV
jgi:predicted transcriptional regulator